MDELESIDSLRAYCDSLEGAAIDDNHVSAEYVAKRTAINVRRYADAIEREAEEKYMALPLDMDGEPIHVGDWMRHCDFTVQCAAVSPERVYYWDECKEGHWVMGVKCRHAKPRTLEDVLRDVVTLCANTWKDEKSAFKFYDVDNVMESGNIADFADEIRELLEVD